jgi:hypothetical protein
MMKSAVTNLLKILMKEFIFSSSTPWELINFNSIFLRQMMSKWKIVIVD